TALPSRGAGHRLPRAAAGPRLALVQTPPPRSDTFAGRRGNAWRSAARGLLRARLTGESTSEAARRCEGKRDLPPSGAGLSRACGVSSPGGEAVLRADRHADRGPLAAVLRAAGPGGWRASTVAGRQAGRGTRRARTARRAGCVPKAVARSAADDGPGA